MALAAEWPLLFTGKAHRLCRVDGMSQTNDNNVDSREQLDSSRQDILREVGECPLTA